MKEKCPDYCGAACVDGSCPMALAREYPEYYDDPVRNCFECSFNMGCEDCINGFYGCEICTINRS